MKPTQKVRVRLYTEVSLMFLFQAFYHIGRGNFIGAQVLIALSDAAASDALELLGGP